MDGNDKVGDDGLLQPTTVIEAVPLVLVAASALLTACAATAWVVGRAFRQLSSITFTLESDYEKRDDGYWVE